MSNYIPARKLWGTISNAWHPCPEEDGSLVLLTLGVCEAYQDKHLTRRDPFNSSPPSAAYMCQGIRSALVQIMAWRLFGAKPSSKPMLGYCQSDPLEQTSVKYWSKFKTFHSRKCIWKYRLWNGGHFVKVRGDELTNRYHAMDKY